MQETKDRGGGYSERKKERERERLLCTNNIISIPKLHTHTIRHCISKKKKRDRYLSKHFLTRALIKHQWRLSSRARLSRAPALFDGRPSPPDLHFVLVFKYRVRLLRKTLEEEIPSSVRYLNRKQKTTIKLQRITALFSLAWKSPEILPMKRC